VTPVNLRVDAGPIGPHAKVQFLYTPVNLRVDAGPPPRNPASQPLYTPVNLRVDAGEDRRGMPWEPCIPPSICGWMQVIRLKPWQWLLLRHNCLVQNPQRAFGERIRRALFATYSDTSQPPGRTGRPSAAHSRLLVS
jgi:hypothetical protein